MTTAERPKLLTLPISKIHWCPLTAFTAERPNPFPNYHYWKSCFRTLRLKINPATVVALITTTICRESNRWVAPLCVGRVDMVRHEIAMSLLRCKQESIGTGAWRTRAPSERPRNC
ncbi:hypothetical protein P154DRAFT_182275 [Amniculicola lignicola CBS 123094]|uniref:Uncharacterized protein n=1 Tax=Amniculicola lignicola CBS 123094 TaxID=1392246 RepID=A0A6A5X1P4_9PLEO|nr:hypothetical protein P154DRAFT_182275 [Amniculicola lignicola CBS 123094]